MSIRAFAVVCALLFIGSVGHGGGIGVRGYEVWFLSFGLKHLPFELENEKNQRMIARLLL